jgi:hypothetical protein
MGCDIHDIVQVRDEQGKWNTVIDNFLDGRHYNLFAVIGDVRNYYDIKPIASYRGIPWDVEWDEDSYQFGDHSQSWVTLEELLNYDWNQTVEVNCVISYSDFLKWDKKSYPEFSASASIAGTEQDGTFRKITTVDMRSMPIEMDPNLSYYVRIYFTRTVRQLAWIPNKMAKLVSLGEPDEVRWVFGFDS